MNMLNRSGELQGKSSEEIAVGHAEYLKNLKAVSMFTGEDAKSARARAQKASEQLAVQSKLAEKGDGAAERFTTAVASMGPEIQKGLQQMTAFDGTIVDKNLNQLLAASPTRKKLLEETYADMENSALTSEEVQKNYQRRVAEYGEALKQEALEAGKTYGALSLLGKGSNEITDMLEKQADLGRQGEAAKSKEAQGLGDTSTQLQKLMTEGIDPTRDQLIKLERVTRENINPTMGQLTQQMNVFTQSMAGGQGIAEAQRRQNELDLKNRKEAMGAILGANITAEPGGKINETTSKVTSALLSGAEKLLKAAGNLKEFTEKILKVKIPGAAKGGRFSGPSDGYLVELHGDETVFNEKMLENLSKLTMPDPKQILENVAGAVAEAPTGSDDMSKIIDTVTASMTGIATQLTAQSQTTEAKFDEMLQALRDKTILEDMLRLTEQTADNTKTMANALA